MIIVKEEFLVSKKLRRAIELGGHEALTLWLFLKGYAAQHPTDGFIPDEEIDDVTHGLVRRARYKLSALTECGHLQRDGSRGPGLVDKVDHGWQLHDYEDHAASQTDEEIRREKARLKKRAQREQKERELAELRKRGQKGTVSPGHLGTDNGDTGEDTDGTSPGDGPGDASAAGGGAPAHGRDTPTGSRGAGQDPNPTHPNPEKESPFPPKEKPRDPFGDSLRGRRTQDDPGVIAVFEAWKLAHGFTNAKFRQPADARADLLFETLKTHDVETCLRVLEASKTDGMVTGKADEQGQEHRSVEYLFKPGTFDRLLRAADLARKKPRGAGGLEASMNAEPDLSDYDQEPPCPPQ